MVTTLAVLGTFFILAGLFVCTNKVDEYWRNRAPQLGALMKPKTITPLWQPVWPGVCADCHTEDEPDRWLPHLCYDCAELARVRKRNG